jgi:prepilin-type N-terminal cleavage/methylation domain-containing protein
MMRPGFTLPEALAALLVGAILMTVLTATIVTQARLTSVVAHTAEATEATWIAGALLSDELRTSLREMDLTASSTDSLALRAFRGMAIVCDTADGRATARWSGTRLPQPLKDSLLHQERALAFSLSAMSLDCAVLPGETRVVFETDTLVAPGDVLLLFEHGSYHLTDRALRWRAGGAGRQPLTAEIFDVGRTGFDAAQSARWADLAAIPHPWAPRQVAVPLRSSLRSLNGANLP